jgi:hypothetical protein
LASGTSFIARVVNAVRARGISKLAMWLAVSANHKQISSVIHPSNFIHFGKHVVSGLQE